MRSGTTNGSTGVGLAEVLGGMFETGGVDVVGLVKAQPVAEGAPDPTRVGKARSG